MYKIIDRFADYQALDNPEKYQVLDAVFKLHLQVVQNLAKMFPENEAVFDHLNHASTYYCIFFVTSRFADNPEVIEDAYIEDIETGLALLLKEYVAIDLNIDFLVDNDGVLHQ